MLIALGILIGLLNAAIILLLHTRFKPQIDRTISQIQSKAMQKGSIIEPEDENLADWLKEIKQ